MSEKVLRIIARAGNMPKKWQKVKGGKYIKKGFLAEIVANYAEFLLYF
ncbi:hypothetical protein [Haemophilus paracuniculus]|nr:hypothetical protein [Haemophilus paracuniculus]